MIRLCVTAAVLVIPAAAFAQGFPPVPPVAPMPPMPLMPDSRRVMSGMQYGLFSNSNNAYDK